MHLTPEICTQIDEKANQAIALLEQLIAIPSFSREEDKTADLIFTYLEKNGVKPGRKNNNVWAFSNDYQENRPTILLNSHHDTVKPAASWTYDPFTPQQSERKLFGLGSNDAGGPLVALLHTFLLLNSMEDRNYNLVFAATAEEEISGANGIVITLPELGKIDLGIVGEPTQMQMAIAEKGLMVIDGMAKGVSGHAARNEGVNAIYIALQDIDWLRTYRLPKKSEVLGEVNLAVTQINAGTQHNVVPDTCTFVIDVRIHEQYTNQEVFDILQEYTQSALKARSFRLNSSGIPLEHPIVQRGQQLGMSYYGSPTLSDQALMHGFPTLKIGPGDSARSHTADEFIFLDEIKQGITQYVALLSGLQI